MPRVTNVLLALLLLLPLTSKAEINPDDLLTADQAFAQLAPTANEGLLTLSWIAAESYYLYGNQFKVTSSNPGLVFGKPITPKGEIKQDELFGEVEVHRGEIQVEVHYQLNTADAVIEIETRSQGCADIGVCYPPQKQTYLVSFTSNSVLQQSSPPPLSSKSESLASRIGGFGADDELLAADEAFILTPKINTNSLIAKFTVAPGYYIYKDKIKMQFEQTEVILGEGSFPPGEWFDDPEFGEVEIYRSDITGVFPIISAAGNYDLTLSAEHQGCAELGLCYPPVKEKFNLSAQLNDTLSRRTNNSPSKTQTKKDWFNNTLAQGRLWQVSLATLGFGILLAFTACMYPMIPILSGIIIGQENKQNAARPFTLSVVYVLSVALTFGVIGLLTATLGGGIGIQAYFQSPWLLIPFTILFTILALSLFGLYDIQVPASLQQKLSSFSNQQKGGNYTGVAIMGVFSALIIGPCGGPILIAALAYAAASANAAAGFIALFFLGLGMGLPLLVIGAGGEKLLPKAGSWMVVVKTFGGVILLAVAILMLERMPSIFPPKLVMMLWSALLIISGYFMFARKPNDASNGWSTLAKALGLFIILFGLIVMLGGLTGGNRVTDPLNGSSLTFSGKNTKAVNNPEFISIKTIADLQQQIKAANANNKTVMLDFYADWCTYCKKYDAYVFPDERVLQALSNTVLLKADVTATDRQDKALMESLNVFLPPAIIFFDLDGQEFQDLRVIGELNADQFLQHIQQVL